MSRALLFRILLALAPAIVVSIAMFATAQTRPSGGAAAVSKPIRKTPRTRQADVRTTSSQRRVASEQPW